MVRNLCFTNDFKRKISWLNRSDSLNVGSYIWRKSLTNSVDVNLPVAWTMPIRKLLQVCFSCMYNLFCYSIVHNWMACPSILNSNIFLTNRKLFHRPFKPRSSINKPTLILKFHIFSFLAWSALFIAPRVCMPESCFVLKSYFGNA